MASNESLIGTVLSHLPKGVSLKNIRAHARLRSGVNRAWGETYFLVHKDELLLLTRSSVFDAYEGVPIAQGIAPRLEKGANQSDVYVETEQGTTCRIPIAPAECDRLERLIARYKMILESQQNG